MVKLYLAYTAPINPLGEKPVLTLAQCWRGLERKVRHAHEFVDTMTSCEVLEDQGDVVKRNVTLINDPSRPLYSECRLYKPTKVDFIQLDGSVITNTLSQGCSDDAEDLHMTYTFEYIHPEISEGDERLSEMLKTHEANAKSAVMGSIETIRRMADRLR